MARFDKNHPAFSELSLAQLCLVVVDIITKKDAKLDDLELQTAKHLQQLANNIFPGMFNVTVDYPSNNPDNKMPLLDLKCWIDPDTNKILHCFYRKPVYRQGVIRYDSGLPYQMKRTILLNHGLRRLSNCSPELDWKSKARWLSELNLFMLESGYNERFRNSLTHKIVGIYSHILRKHFQGTNMYRDPKTK